MSESTPPGPAPSAPSLNPTVAAAAVMARTVLLAPPECVRWCEQMTEQERLEVVSLADAPHADQKIEQLLTKVADRIRPPVAEAVSDAPAEEPNTKKRRNK